MSHFKLILITFFSAFTMLAYQNCQKMGFNESVSDSNQSASSLEPTTVAFDLNYGMGYGYCMGRCLSGAKISADLASGIVTIHNYIYDNSGIAAAVAPPPVRTDFEISLTKEQLKSLQEKVKAIVFEERFVPDCIEGGICAIMMDAPYHTHYFTDSTGQKQIVFTANSIDSNLRGVTYWVMDDPLPLGCDLKAIIESADLSPQEREESLEGLKSALSLYEGSNPLICSK